MTDASPTPRIVAADPTLTTQAPSDVLRLVVAVGALLVVVIFGLVLGGEIVDGATDLLRGLDVLPGWLVTAQVALAELAALALVVLLVGQVVRRRSARPIGAAALAIAIAVALTAGLSAWIGVTDTATTVTSADATLSVAGETWPALLLAGLAALAGTLGPWTTRRRRRISWALVLFTGLTHFVATPISFDTLLALLSGWAAGAAATVVLGSPSMRPRGAAIAAGLAAVGVPLAELEQASLDARGSTPYFGTTTDGSKLFVKALGTDERSADLLFRLYRRVQPRDLADEKPFSTLRRTVEHEALVSLAARDAGIRTPRVVAFATTADPDGFVLAYEAIAGRSLDRLSAEETTDEVLDQVWGLVGQLRERRIAHRDLRLANVFVDDSGDAWMIDFGFSELAASDTLLATDIAELIASSATLVGAGRAVAAAHRNVGPEVAASALERLRLPFLSGATRTALKADPATLERVRQLVAQAA